MNNENNNFSELIDKSIQYLYKYIKNNKEYDTNNDYNIWKAYSWIEYCILLVRIRNYNLLDNYHSATQIKRKKCKKDDIEKILLKVIDKINNINKDNIELCLKTLRECRDDLIIILRSL